MCRLVRSVIIVLLGLSACTGQDDIEDYAGNGKSAVVSTTRTKDQDVSILKQIHRHNEDGSYTYGYEGSDGSFKIETKTQTGEVTGKYGYVDDLGKLRVVEYGANKYGFQPAGEGITVPSPTLVEHHQDTDDEDEEPEEERPRPAKRPSPQKPVSRPDNRAFAQQPRPQPQPQPQPQFQRQPQPTSNAVRTSVSDFDDYDSAGWTAQSAEPQRSVPPKPATRPRPAAGRFGGSAAAVVAVRPKSLTPPVAGSFRAAPEEEPGQQGPSASFQTVQDFGGRLRAASRSDSTIDRSYQTSEDQQEPETEPPALFQPVTKPARRNGGGSARAASTPSLSAGSYRSAPRQMRTSGILDQLAEQYALPESRSPVSHSVSFGLDQ